MKLLTKTPVSGIIRFLGGQAILFLGLGVVTGLIVFGVEFGFAYGLQAFLISIGAIQIESAHLPSWVPHSPLKSVLLFVTGFGVLRSVMQWIQLYLYHAAAETQRLRQRNHVVDWIFHSQAVSTGEASALLNDNVMSTAECVTNLQRLSVVTTTSLLLWFYLLKLALAPTLIATLLVVVIGAFMTKLDRRVAAGGAQMTRESGQMQSLLLNSIKNLLLIQIYSTQEIEKQRIRKTIAAYCHHTLGFVRILGIKYNLPQLLGVFLVSVITVTTMRSQNIAPVLLVTYFYLFVRLAQILADGALNFSNFIFHWSRLKNFYHWWITHQDAFTQVADATSERTEPLREPVGWRLTAVSYSYPGASAPVLSNVHLIVEPRKTLVITGPSGSGKSTLIFLLLGLIKPSQGIIEVMESGKNTAVEKVKKSLLSSVGYVGPESFLIHGTVLSNLTYGLLSEPSDSEIKRALDLAECDFVFKQTLGLNHLLTEQGHGLSAGQKQRLSLARAILRKPKVLILDEATSNLDSETEERLVHVFQRLKSEMTIVVATHRDALLKLGDIHFKLS